MEEFIRNESVKSWSSKWYTVGSGQGGEGVLQSIKEPPEAGGKKLAKKNLGYVQWPTIRSKSSADLVPRSSIYSSSFVFVIFSL